MKVITWNVNGLRAVQKKNFAQWFEGENADLVCLQETKISEDQLREDKTLFRPASHNCYSLHAKKAGYSGLVTYSKKEPDLIVRGLGSAEFDDEARWLELHFGQDVFINSYFPNSQREHTRLPFKLAFCSLAGARLEILKSKGLNVFLCGDFNIAHKEIDLKNPKTNVDNAGFLPEERAWLDHMIAEKKWIDAFREFEKGPEHYTWWSYRPGVREKNIGWRLDYFLVNPAGRAKIKNVEIKPMIKGSDHCPVILELHSK